MKDYLNRKNLPKQLFQAGIVASLLFGASTSFAGNPPLVKVKPKPLVKKDITLKNPRLGQVAGQLGCPDLTITNIRVKSIQHYNRVYYVELSADIKNVGSADYRSARNQQQVSFHAAGLNDSTIPFGNVGKGRSVQTGAIFRGIQGGEFTPDVVAQLVFDPDIRMDKNKLNDDCNPRNNKTVLPRSVIQRAIANYNRTHH